MVCGGKRHLYLNSRLRGVRKLYVAFHELAHHFFHTTPSTASASFYRVVENSRDEIEAEAFALIALIPEPLLRSMLAGEIEEVYGYTSEMLKFRLKVLDRYGL